MKGALLKETLETGLMNKGEGGYLQLYQVEKDEKSGRWMVNGKPLIESKFYHIALNSFLLTGLEDNMGFLKPEENDPDMKNIDYPDENDKNDPRSDIRKSTIEYMKETH